jgi:hypothetical protein
MADEIPNPRNTPEPSTAADDIHQSPRPLLPASALHDAHKVIRANLLQQFLARPHPVLDATLSILRREITRDPQQIRMMLAADYEWHDFYLSWIITCQWIVRKCAYIESLFSV